MRKNRMSSFFFRTAKTMITNLSNTASSWTVIDRKKFLPNIIMNSKNLHSNDLHSNINLEKVI